MSSYKPKIFAQCCKFLRVQTMAEAMQLINDTNKATALYYTRDGEAARYSLTNSSGHVGQHFHCQCLWLTKALGGWKRSLFGIFYVRPDGVRSLPVAKPLPNAASSECVKVRILYATLG